MNWQIVAGAVVFIVLFVVDNFIYQVDLVLYLIVMAVSIYLLTLGQKKNNH